MTDIIMSITIVLALWKSTEIGLWLGGKIADSIGLKDKEVSEDED